MLVALIITGFIARTSIKSGFSFLQVGHVAISFFSVFGLGFAQILFLFFKFYRGLFDDSSSISTA
ncbi:hypothetical protein LEP1GSC107_2153 [Leptospira interrogans serovar Grippotyphosa str. UI 12769]|uniref:Uncharacterized protein n=4 Tax=Leptospira TaxID=171 RepID=M6ZMD5_LEPIR|nr:conserved hypothetical protein [Leptospira interrogans serovar Copenhageni str. Fiocruz L1-130]EKO05045.1 hypothetical protein LEP1GSC077_1104 [Leptospira interrogans str. C10069]EKO16182.1 hypothetical protein LEP1GSC081_3553 [Leptospira kirschneri str. H1]EKO63000.1 hypothetical protein LEP1GSC082_3233 [Leptospira kirschneri str. H2]EKR36598.1 hypothetical protein LEP1GSC096_0409 [Leptospira interrogans serovar Hebdomadis str. R499]EKR46420.1 hypothetical protein LEP1GSC097_3680 [Leptospi